MTHRDKNPDPYRERQSREARRPKVPQNRYDKRSAEYERVVAVHGGRKS